MPLLTFAISSHPYRDTGKGNRAVGIFLPSHRTAHRAGTVYILALKTFLEVQHSNVFSETIEIISQPGISVKLVNEYTIPD